MALGRVFRCFRFCLFHLLRSCRRDCRLACVSVFECQSFPLVIMSRIKLERTAQLWGVSGNLGGGKTMSAVQFAVLAISEGYYVCSNITLDIDRICSVYGSYCRHLYQHISLDDPGFDPFKLPCGSPRGSAGGKRVLVILDECAEWVDQYSSAKDPRISRLWSWLRHSSKRSQDVFVVIQRPDYLNKVIRILVSRWIWVYDLAVWRVPYLKLRLPFCGNFVLRAIFDAKGLRIGPLSVIRKDFWGQFYNTAECLNSDGATYVREYEVPARPPRRLVWLYVLLLLSQFWLFRALQRLDTLVPVVPRAVSSVRSEAVLWPYPCNASALKSKSLTGGALSLPLFSRSRENLSQKNGETNSVLKENSLNFLKGQVCELCTCARTPLISPGCGSICVSRAMEGRAGRAAVLGGRNAPLGRRRVSAAPTGLVI